MFFGRAKMKNHICPHCGKPSISIIKKAFIGPVVRRKCSECGNFVGLKAAPFYAVILPVLAMIVVLGFIDYKSYMALVIILMIIAAFFVNDRFVPIVKK
jgi:endogenous inhibitor of DNA gyrase (YacG/DUF329 family)